MTSGTFGIVDCYIWYSEVGLVSGQPSSDTQSIQSTECRATPSGQSTSKERRFVQRFVTNLISKALRYGPIPKGSHLPPTRTIPAFTR